MKAAAGLLLYKRHNAECLTNLKKLRVKPSALRFYHGCDCAVWIAGRLPDGTAMPRKSLKVSDFGQAEMLRDAALGEIAHAAQEVAVFGPALGDCARQFIASRVEEVCESTECATRYALDRFIAWMAARSLIRISDVTVDLLERFKAEGLEGLAPGTKCERFKTIRMFLRDAYRRNWINENLADKVKPYRYSRSMAKPYSEPEVEKILDAIHADYPESPKVKIQGENLRAIIELMLLTGMRVSDAVLFEPARVREIRQGGALTYTFQPCKQIRTKAKKSVDVYLTSALMQKMSEIEWSSETRPFYRGNVSVKGIDTATRDVRRAMRRLGEASGVEDCRPHRLRDTCAVRLILRGVSIQNISKLLGHSSVMITEQYYLAWTTERSAQLGDIITKASMDPVRNTGRNRKKSAPPAREAEDARRPANNRVIVSGDTPHMRASSRTR